MGSPTRQYRTSSAEESADLGRKIGEKLGPGAVVALRGPLGAGKTVFCRGLARALGVDEEPGSPTYTILAKYSGKTPLVHIDAWRLGDGAEFDYLDEEEPFSGGVVTVVEWPEHIESSLPERTVWITVEVAEAGRVWSVPGEFDV